MGALKSWQTAIAAALALCYWVVVLAIPSDGSNWSDGLRIAIGAAAGILIVVAIVGLLISTTGRGANQRGVLILLGLAGVVLGIVALVTEKDLEFTDAKRMAVGVGGLAIAGLVYGITRFDSVRAAVSVPAAVLVIGAATWPGSEELIAEDFRSEIVKWMGILLGATGLAEAGKQIGEASANAKVQTAAITTATADSSEIEAAQSEGGIRTRGDLVSE